MRNKAIYLSGYPCHIHNCAQKGGKAFEKTCGFDVEDLGIDLFNWFEKSTEHKNIGIVFHFLQSRLPFCDTTCQYKLVGIRVGCREVFFTIF